MITRNNNGKIYDKSKASSYGEFVRKCGGYGAYNKWIREFKRVPVKVEKKVGRNDKCFCGSNRKFKKCCMGK